jgi:hypothetical protein
MTISDSQNRNLTSGSSKQHLTISKFIRFEGDKFILFSMAPFVRRLIYKKPISCPLKLNMGSLELYTLRNFSM